jgi:hypothetical protein
MTEFVTAVFGAATSAISTVASGVGSLFSGGAATATAAGGATGGAVGTAAGGAASGLSFGSILQGGMGLLSMMSALRAGQSQADMYTSQAADTRLDVTQEGIDATERQTGLRKQLLAALGERDTAYAASGVDLSFGTPVQARTEAIQEANNAITVDQSNADLRQSRLRSRAASLDGMAADAKSAAKMKAAGILFDTGLDIYKRGQ